MTQIGQLIQALPALEAELAKRENYQIRRYYPDGGPYRRELYRKHTACLAAGAEHRIRAMVAANRVGKTMGVGAYEGALHLTGRYDDYAPWWKGRRLDGPVSMWAAGDTGKTTRDILQKAFLGSPTAPNSGMLPAHLVTHTSAKQGVPDAIEQVWVRHVSGGMSTLTFKSYDQRREAFQGTSQHVILLDEEPPEDVYTECVLRSMKTSDFPGGIILVTFTPLQGMTELVLKMLPGGQFDDEARARLDGNVFFCDWDEVAHLGEAEKAEMLKEIPAYQRDARSKGIPQLGSGAVYQVPESEVRITDFPVPAHWVQWYAFDSGWEWTAATFHALDRDTDTEYITGVYKRQHAEPAVHADAIRARGGDWLEGVGDVAAVSNTDGVQFIDIYKRLGLNLQLADKAVEAGIQQVYQRLSAGRLKVFASCGPWFDEYRLYRRDEKGRIVKKADHLMDAMRYGERAPVHLRKTKGAAKPKDESEWYEGRGSSAQGWMA